MAQVMTRVIEHVFGVTLAILCSPLLAGAADLQIQVLKIDPNPVSMNVEVETLLRVENTSAAAIHAQVQVKSDEVHTLAIDVPAAANVMVTVPARFGAIGMRPLKAFIGTLEATWVWVRSGVVFKRVPVTKFTVSSSTSGTVEVRGPLPAPPIVDDISPDEPAGTNGDSTASGVVQQLAAAPGVLYAAGKTGGVWASRAGGVWRQLVGSPSRAISIAIDPGDPLHLVVGEREDEASDARVGRSALWHSTSTGQWWEELHDPQTRGIRQAIPSLAFSPFTRTLIFATHSGVGRWPLPQARATESAIEYPPTARGDITAVAAGDVRLWARTVNAILFSDDDGRTWTREALPTSVSPGGGVPTFAPNYDSTPKGNASDRGSLAGFDDRAFLIFNSPPGVQPPDKSGSPLLIFSPEATGAKRWVAQWTHDNDGRGLAGRRFVRAFHLFKCPALNDLVGQRLQLFYGSGQGVQRATGIAPDGTVTFGDPMLTKRNDPGDDRDQNPVHADLWDVAVGPDYCPPSQSTVWVASDGGIYEGTGESASLFGLNWRTRSDGLHLHNAHDLRIVRAVPGRPTLLAYPTTDNGAWFRNSDGSWSGQGFMGDANFAASDTVSPLALVWRQPWGNGKPEGVISGFGSSFLGSDGNDTKRYELNRDTSFDGPTAVHAIVPLPNERVSPDGTLDVAMLTNAPLTDSSGNPVSGTDASGVAWPSPVPAQPVVIRNPKFTVHTDASTDKFKDWKLIALAPPGAIRLWTAGGLASTRFFIQVAPTAAIPSGLAELQSGTWVARGGLNTLLPPNMADDQGPIFPNPYNPKIMIAAYTTPGGAQVVGLSRNGGQSFCPSIPLTALLTDSGAVLLQTSAISSHFTDISTTYHGPASRLNPVSVVFDPLNPNRVFIAAMEARIITGNLKLRPTDLINHVACPEPTWYDLSPALRAPRPYLSAVRYDAEALFVSTQGRGILKISALDRARPVAWFTPNTNFGPTQPLATLNGGAGELIPYGFVTARLIPMGASCTGATGVTESHRTDATGTFLLNAATVAGCQYRVDLEFRSDGGHEATRTRFLSTR